MAAAVDLSEMEVLAELRQEGRIDVESLINHTGNIPAAATGTCSA